MANGGSKPIIKISCIMSWCMLYTYNVLHVLKHWWSLKTTDQWTILNGILHLMDEFWTFY